MRFATGVRTDVGRVRSVNEDSVAVADGLAVVADGMGGHRGGEVASQLAVAAFEAMELPTSVDALVDAVRRANSAVLERALGDRTLAGMGTTLCAVGALADDGSAVGVVNVGDSRVYLLDGAVLRQISEDHSFVETLVREGRLTPEQAEVHPQRNVLTRALGIEADLLVDAWRVEVADGDRFLLCSDGLFNEVAESTIAEVLGRGDAAGETAAALVDLALASGARDNVSCVVVDVVESGREGPLPERTVHRTAGADPDRPPAEVPGDTTGEPGLAHRGPVGPDETVVAAPPRRRRVTWRVGVLTLAVVATLAAAVGSVAWFARNTWWVKAADGQVAIFQGPPGGLLGIDPRVTPQGLALEDVVGEDKVVAVRDGIDFGRDQAAAQAYVDDLVADAAAATSTTTTSTTTSTTTTTTAAPPAEVAPAPVAPTSPPGGEPAPAGAP